MDDLLLNQPPPNESPSSAGEEQLQRTEPRSSLLKSMSPCQLPSIRGVLKRGLPSRDTGMPPTKKIRSAPKDDESVVSSPLGKKNVSITLPTSPHCMQSSKKKARVLKFFRNDSRAQQDRRLEIASMLDRATRFAHDVEESSKLRQCTSSPPMGYEPQQQQHGPQRRPRGQRYSRRNSFVIHRGKGLSSYLDCNTFNATFSLPPDKPPTNNDTKQQTTCPLGLTKQESHLVLKRLSRESSTTSETDTADETSA